MGRPKPTGIISNMQLVDNEIKYWKFILNLRNHPTVKQGFVEQREITEEEHYNFMRQYGDCYFICLAQGTPAGFVGSIKGDIRVATHPDFQGHGVGKYMINELMKRYPDSFAKVKIHNRASEKLFESCGFKKKYYIMER